MKLHNLSISQLQILESGQLITKLITDYETSELKSSTDTEFEL